ncbi:hypothetical protein B0J18DRAFT_405827 [Chaetomium sp. MPI-SDFR-AT-0129]|nr:hypothetical protein B0J18DRAFT_405827 [Chaetomium sp. MPI-SDFR-AT-0129]
MGKSKSGLSAPSKAIDPTLDALFSQSAGSVKTPPKSRYSDLLPQRPRTAAQGEDNENDEDEDDQSESSEADPNADFATEGLGDDEEMSSGDDEILSDVEMDNVSDLDDDSATATQPAVLEASREDGKKRKRRHRDDDENLEANYLERLVNEEEPSGKRRKGDGVGNTSTQQPPKDKEMDDSDSEGDIPVHESVAAGPAVSELEKANRTVFLSNVSAEAITSRSAKKTLLNHLSSVLDKKADPPQKVESIRFRSTAFETAGIPKRAAYIKKQVLEATTKSTNAYAVYSTTAAARLAVAQLNGTTVLDRHLRVDSVAHPSPVDHRRCVFVGNLGFVGDESVYNTKLDENGKEVTEKRKRTKTPMDIDEGLWRAFNKEAGKVESVRVVRDAATRVGKGFAYVQFYDANSVEAAILLNGKKFPPMLPRELRVSRCKAPHKTARAMEARTQRAAGSDRKPGAKGDASKGKYVPKPTAESQTLAGRASKLLGRFGAAHLTGKPVGGNKKRRDRRDRFLNRNDAAGGDKNDSGIKGPEQFVFEGRRASARDGKPKDLKFKKGKAKPKPRAPNKKGKSGKVSH